MNCAEINEKLVPYLLGELDEPAAKAVREHMDGCEACRASAREIEQTLGLLRDALAASSTVPKFSEAARKRIFAAKQAAPVKLPRRIAVWFTAPHQALAVAASIVVVAGFVWLATRLGHFTMHDKVMASGEVRLQDGTEPGTVQDGFTIRGLRTKEGKKLEAPSPEGTVWFEGVEEGKKSFYRPISPAEADVHDRAGADDSTTPNMPGAPEKTVLEQEAAQLGEGTARVTVNGVAVEEALRPLPPASVAQPAAPKPAPFDSVSVVRSPMVMKGAYANRNAEGQEIAGEKAEAPAAADEVAAVGGEDGAAAAETAQFDPKEMPFMQLGPLEPQLEALIGDLTESERSTAEEAHRHGNIGRQGMADGESGAGSGTIGKGDANMERGSRVDSVTAADASVGGIAAGEVSAKTKEATGRDSGEDLNRLMARTEALHVKASLLNIRSESLGIAAHSASQAQDAIAKGLPPEQIKEYQKRAVEALKKAQVELKRGEGETAPAATTAPALEEKVRVVNDVSIGVPAAAPEPPRSASEKAPALAKLPSEPIRGRKARSDGWDSDADALVTVEEQSAGDTAEAELGFVPDAPAKDMSDAVSAKADRSAVHAPVDEPLRAVGGKVTEARNKENETLVAAGVVTRIEQKAKASKPADSKKTELTVMQEALVSAIDDSDRAAHFEAPAVNQFVNTVDQAFSTFSIDVDTASYTLCRNFLLRGLLPPPEAVRVEEFVNFFDYNYPAPEKDTFKVYTECAPSPFGRGLFLLKIGVKGQRLGREEQRPAVLTILMDTSGSMEQPDRLDLARRAVKMLVEKLGPNDRVALVQCDSHARIVLESTPAAEKQKILDAVDGLQCSGSTNLEDGMDRAYQVALRNITAGAENRVLILSDGVANLGGTGANEILGKVEQARKQGVFCSVFGFGMGAYDDVMLETLANKGNGTYAFIDSVEEAKRVFVDDLAATLNTIAKDVKIQVEFNPAAVARYRQVGYENRRLNKEDFRNDAVDAGEVGSGKSVTALYEFESTVMPSGKAIAQPEGLIATVRVRYQRVADGRVEEIETRMMPEHMKRVPERTSPGFMLAAATAEFAEILRGSPHAAGSEYKDVATLLRPVALELKLDPRVQELVRLVEQAGSCSRAEPGTSTPVQMK